MEAPRDESALKSVDEKPTISSRMADSSTEKETELVDAESLEYQASVKSDTDVSITCEQSASVCSRDQGLEWSEPFSAITCSEISGSLFTDTEAGASQFFYNQQSSYEDRNIVKSSKLFDTHDDGFSSNHSDFTNSRSISVRKFRTFMNPISVTYLKKQFYVLGSTSSRPINVYTSSGFARGAFVLKRHDDRQVACVPSILRSCQTKQWIILIDQSNDRIVCARPNGIVDAIVNTHSGLQDAISTGQHIIACFPSSGIFISSLDNVEQLSQLDILGVPEPLLPMRLAWCSNSVTLLVVDVNETNSDSYRIRAFQLCDQGLKLLDFPSLAIDSSVIPSAIMNDSELVIGRLNGTTAVFSWLASNSDSMSAQYDLLELESCKTGIESFPIDMNWVPTEKGTFAVCKNSGYVIVISYSSLQHQSAKSDSAANLTQDECEPTEGIAADRAPTDRTEAEGVMSREDEHAVGMGASSLLTGDAELHTLDVSVDVVRLANDFFTEVVSETLIKGCPMPKTDNASHTVKALTACKNHSDSTLHSNSRINSERFAGKGPTEQVASHAQNVLQLFKVSKPKSAAVLSDRIYVSEGSGRGCFSVYNLTGKKLESIRLCTLGGEAVDITAYRIRLSCTGQWIIVSHPTNKQIACVNPAGRLLHSLKVPKGGFEDAICTSRQLIIACPGGRIYTAIFDNLTEIKLCSTDLKISCPVRMAWCNKSETLLVVDRTSIKTEEYRILAFKIDSCQLTALPAPRLTIQSSVAPNVLLKADEMVLVWVSDSTCTISWLPTNAMHLAAEHCSATIEDISPRDICWLPPETSSFGEAIICDAKGSVLAFRRPLYG
ncbi:hypothetical protein BOX15_Mlig019517g1 [Macrostomum lignano]|uniref:Uncharacterized protein n=1 Tax=Macrostomum lignano TaxID=282301 RepID=A0A267EJX2_9PLAT|nr:hypothetical protein BOX15_Mlig019517g1 [Macrostomum lignano]